MKTKRERGGSEINVMSKNEKGNSAWEYPMKTLATLFVVALGVGAMYLSDGKTGVGWAILGVLLIWVN